MGSGVRESEEAAFSEQVRIKGGGRGSAASGINQRRKADGGQRGRQKRPARLMA